MILRIQKKKPPTKAALDCQTNAPNQLIGKCVQYSVKNIHTNVGLRIVKAEEQSRVTGQ